MASLDRSSPDNEFVTLTDVEILHSRAFGIDCRIGMLDIFVPAMMIADRRYLDSTGTHVSLTVPRWFALGSGLL
jgi:DNA-directed RNA polymerase subunit E'/Rpb7